jgi:NAD(P)-dependent dehydrogenase (short-subunit alcohol dehydrogenase family)
MTENKVAKRSFFTEGRRYEKIRAQQRSIKRSQVENDLVGTVLFLSSPESDFMTGQLLNVDGGFHFVG